uniref:Uncharacterized protein n=1 Tax=Rhizophora mucronata TaxID=61149 RepID=A0A2P2QEL2_RHIMU
MTLKEREEVGGQGARHFKEPPQDI